MSLHPLVRAAARGRLPEWAVAGKRRRAHLERVAALMKTWARARDLSNSDVRRWTAAGVLHDALRDADPEDLRDQVPPGLRDLHGKVLHGPAAAARLKKEGVDDPSLLRAVAYHTLGHPGFDDLGRALYAADFLEPGRSFSAGWREQLRERMPDDLDQVAREILEARIRHLLDRSRPVRPETMEFWNVMTTGQPWAGASEL